jgi:PAS domain S-box-containing protein
MHLCATACTTAQWGALLVVRSAYPVRMSATPIPDPLEILDLIQDAVFVVDEHGNFLYVSAGCENLLGYRAAELIGRHMIEFVHPDDRGRTTNRVWQIMQGVSATRFSNRWIHKFGHSVHIDWAASWSAKHRVRVATAREVDGPAESI